MNPKHPQSQDDSNWHQELGPGLPDADYPSSDLSAADVPEADWIEGMEIPVSANFVEETLELVRADQQQIRNKPTAPLSNGQTSIFKSGSRIRGFKRGPAGTPASSRFR